MNPNILPWDHYQDLQVSDEGYLRQYEQFIKEEQYYQAMKLLTSKAEIFRGKQFVADSIMKIVHGVKALQTQFDTEVNVFLDDLSNRYAQLVDQMVDKGEWSPTVQYEAYNFVHYKSKLFMAVHRPPLGASPDIIDHWFEIDLNGIEGVPGNNVVMRYDWTPALTYRANDLVVYQGNIYVALKENAGVVPESDETVWLLYIQTSEGGIYVGVAPPAIAVQNSIWFKVDEEPTTATKGLNGQFMVMDRMRTWTPMNPKTTASNIEGRGIYGTKAKYKFIQPRPTDWIPFNGKYKFSYDDSDILDSSYIELFQAEPYEKAQQEAYDSLVLQVQHGHFDLITDEIPTVALPIRMKIQ